jgi:hypothetical protein
MLGKIYLVLYVLLLIIINPFGLQRGEIWTIPKVSVLVFICILNSFIIQEHRSELAISRRWIAAALLWIAFLFIALLSTCSSNFPWYSVFGQEQMGDGLLYWLITAYFFLSNSLVLSIFPHLFYSQLKGLITGGLIVSLSIFPQVLNWQIDYTINSGKVFAGDILASTIFKNHQPIGLYSHRGHASIVIAIVFGLLLWAVQKGFMPSHKLRLPVSFLMPALLLTQTRASFLAVFIAFFYSLRSKYSI